MKQVLTQLINSLLSGIAGASLTPARKQRPDYTCNNLKPAFPTTTPATIHNQPINASVCPAALLNLTRRTMQQEHSAPATDEMAEEFAECVAKVAEQPNGALKLDIMLELLKNPDLLEAAQEYIEHPVAILSGDRALELLLSRLREGAAPQIQELSE